MVVDPNIEAASNTDVISGLKPATPSLSKIGVELSISTNKKILEQELKKAQDRLAGRNEKTKLGDGLAMDRTEALFKDHGLLNKKETLRLRDTTDFKIYTQNLRKLASIYKLEQYDNLSDDEIRKLFKDGGISREQKHVLLENNKVKKGRNAGEKIESLKKERAQAFSMIASKLVGEDVAEGFRSSMSSVHMAKDGLKLGYYTTIGIAKGVASAGRFAGRSALKTNMGQDVYKSIASTSFYQRSKQIESKANKVYGKTKQKIDDIRHPFKETGKRLNRKKVRLDNKANKRLLREKTLKGRFGNAFLDAGGAVKKTFAGAGKAVAAPFKLVNNIKSWIVKQLLKILVAAGGIILGAIAIIVFVSILQVAVLSVSQVFVGAIDATKEFFGVNYVEVNESMLMDGINTLMEEEDKYYSNLNKEINDKKPSEVYPRTPVINRDGDEIEKFDLAPVITLKGPDGSRGAAADNKKVLMSMACVWSINEITANKMNAYIKDMYEKTHHAQFRRTEIFYDRQGQECMELSYKCSDPDILPSQRHDRCKEKRMVEHIEYRDDGYLNCKGHKYNCTDSTTPPSLRNSHECKVVTKDYSKCKGHYYFCGSASTPKDLKKSSCYKLITNPYAPPNTYAYQCPVRGHFYHCYDDNIPDSMKHDECCTEKITYECHGNHTYNCNNLYNQDLGYRHNECKKITEIKTEVWNGEYHYDNCTGHGAKYGKKGEGIPYCPGHIGLIVEVEMDAFKDFYGIDAFTQDTESQKLAKKNNDKIAKDMEDFPNLTTDEVIEKTREHEELWTGWEDRDEDQPVNRNLVEAYYNEDWYETYGIAISGLASLPGVAQTYTDWEVEKKLIDVYAHETAVREKTLTRSQMEIVRFAYESAGLIPYYWGGKYSYRNFWENEFGKQISPDDSKHKRNLRGLDCSGFVCYTYLVVSNNNLGRSGTATLRNYGDYYAWNANGPEIEVGDIVWKGQTTSKGEWAGHVGIYVGNGKVIEEAGNPNNNVIESDLQEGIDSNRWMGYIKMDKREMRGYISIDNITTVGSHIY